MKPVQYGLKILMMGDSNPPKLPTGWNYSGLKHIKLAESPDKILYYVTFPTGRIELRERKIATQDDVIFSEFRLKLGAPYIADEIFLMNILPPENYGTCRITFKTNPLKGKMLLKEFKMGSHYKNLDGTEFVVLKAWRKNKKRKWTVIIESKINSSTWFPTSK